MTFDGTGISVFDLKKEIILANNLSKANDFDLVVLDSTGEGWSHVSEWMGAGSYVAICAEYNDDSQVIPRSSSVVVKRVPSRPGRGSVGRYLGAGPAQASADSAGKSSAGGGSWHNRAGGNMSRRFDGREPKEDAKTAERPPQPVCLVLSSRFSQFTYPPGPHIRYSCHSGRRSRCDGCHVPSTNCELGGGPGKDVTVGVARTRCLLFA